MSEWFYLILLLGATFGLLVCFMMIMSIVVMLSELEKKENTHSPARLVADEFNEALKEETSDAI